jgi:hypothetical protein
MLVKYFKCHYCEDIFEGSPHVKVGMYLGFVWNPIAHDTPYNFIDFCQPCTEVFFKKYKEGKMYVLNQGPMVSIFRRFLPKSRYPVHYAWRSGDRFYLSIN